MNTALAQAVLAVGRHTDANIQLLGTGFVVAKDRLATTAHVTGPSEENLCVIIPKIKRLDEYQDTTDHNVNVLAVKIAAYDPIRDISILSVADAAFQIACKLGSSDMVPTGAPIVTLG